MGEVKVRGLCLGRFGGVRDAFEENFALRKDVGAAVAVFIDGELVVNLQGGSAGPPGAPPWHEDTLVPIFSATKGLSSTCVHQLVERGRLDLDKPVAYYWPEFGRAGKEGITVAMVLGHRSGTIGPRSRLRWREVANWNLVCERLAASEPWWAPGTAQGYAAVSFGYIIGEVFRRVEGRTVSEYLSAEIAKPLGLDVYIGLPESEWRRCAEVANQDEVTKTLTGVVSAAGDPTSLADHKRAGVAVSMAMGFIPDETLRLNDMELWRSVCNPANSGHVSALGLAGFYNALAEEKLLSRRQMDLARTNQAPDQPDVVLGPRSADNGFGLGYMLNQHCVIGPNPRIFGHGGAGGSFGFVDLENRIGYAYVMNYYDIAESGCDPRSVALINALYASLGLS